MSIINEICKEGKVTEAYQMAKKNFEHAPNDSNSQRDLGWVLYYLVKQDAEDINMDSLLAHLDEVNQLDLLTAQNEPMLWENILYKVGKFVYHSNTDDEQNILSKIFKRLRSHHFEPSNGYSFLLKSFIKHDKDAKWQEWPDFIEWWDLEKLQPDDYNPYITENGKTTLSLSEKAYMRMSKALLGQEDINRIDMFLPKLKNLIENYPTMTWLPYFYCKLRLLISNNGDDIMKIFRPFLYKKSSEFWVWKLLSEVFAENEEKQLACLLRAIHCKTEDKFIGKVRLKLAKIYSEKKEYDWARFQIDKLTNLYLSNGWKLPHEIADMTQSSWFNDAQSKDNETNDYLQITDAILCEGTTKSTAIVSYFDSNSKKATIVYGREKTMKFKPRFNVSSGDALTINYVIDDDNKIQLVCAGKITFTENLDFAKRVDGIVKKQENKNFAFLMVDNNSYYIPPDIVSKYSLSDEKSIQALILYDYNDKKEEWSWKCVRVLNNK